MDSLHFINKENAENVCPKNKSNDRKNSYQLMMMFSKCVNRKLLLYMDVNFEYYSRTGVQSIDLLHMVFYWNCGHMSTRIIIPTPFFVKHSQSNLHFYDSFHFFDIFLTKKHKTLSHYKKGFCYYLLIIKGI